MEPGIFRSEHPANISIAGVGVVKSESSSLFRRITWGICILFGTGFLAYHCYDRISYFSSTPTMVDIQVHYPNDLFFPSVQICNANQYKVMTHLYEDKDSETGMSLDEEVYFALNDWFQAKHFEHDMHDYNITKMFVKYGHAIEDMLDAGSCVFSMKDCGAENFTRTFIDYEMCYTFNWFGANLKTRVPGIQFGFMLELDPEMQFYHALTNEVGFKVFIHAQDEVPTIFSASSFITLNPGTTTYVALRLVENRQLPVPYGKCGVKSLKYYKRYSQSLCKLECMANYSKEVCGCRLMQMPDTAPVCEPTKYNYCLRRLISDYATATHNCECPINCNSHEYQRKITISAAPKSGRKILWDYSHLARLYVFYEDLQHDVIVQSTVYTWLALLSDLGGCLGLMLGACFLTLAEIVDLIMVVSIQNTQLTLRYGLMKVIQTTRKITRGISNINGEEGEIEEIFSDERSPAEICTFQGRQHTIAKRYQSESANNLIVDWKSVNEQGEAGTPDTLFRPIVRDDSIIWRRRSSVF